MKNMVKLTRKKRGAIKIGKIERDYGVKFGVRADMKLSNYLKRVGLPSMSKALKYIEQKGLSG